MKHQYEIKQNPKMPTAEEVEQFKDFDRLLQQYEQKAKPKPRRTTRPIVWTIGMLALAASLTGVFFWVNSGNTFSEEEYLRQQQAHFAQQPFVQPPLDAVRPSFVAQKVNASAGGLLTYNNQTKLSIPEQAFEDENGQLV